MKTRALLVLLAVVSARVASAQSVDLRGSEVSRALDLIRPEALTGHVRFLADDLLEGRGTATRGYDLAAAYVAARFEAAGLEPGAGGSWLQPVPLRRTVLESATVTLVHKGRERRLTLHKDFVTTGDPNRAVSEVAAGVVFAGYGITAPELGYDDFAGVDVRGKIVAILSGAPPNFPPDQRAHHSNGKNKDANLVAHGAAGVLSIRTPVDEKRSSWERTVRQSKLPSMRWLDEEKRVHDGFPELKGSVTLTRESAEALFEGAPRTLEQVFAEAEAGKPQAFAMPVEARLRRRSRLSDVTSPNVVGVLKGSDAKLSREAVVYTAHLDHLGISTPVDGDSINNGAFDNATGIASMIEIAGAFAASKPRPRRSLLFVAVTAEEKGLVGSDYFAQHPTMPIEDIVANVNLDMFVMVHPMKDMIAYGAEHSSLGPIAKSAVERVGLKLGPDPAPEEVIFVRSDQYSFVKRGVPAVFLVHGHDSGDPKQPGEEAISRWLKTIYHSPQDDLRQPIDEDAFLRFTRAAWLIGHVVARQTARPTWNAGDFFGESFGRRAASP